MENFLFTNWSLLKSWQIFKQPWNLIVIICCRNFKKIISRWTSWIRKMLVNFVANKVVRNEDASSWASVELLLVICQSMLIYVIVISSTLHNNRTQLWSKAFLKLLFSQKCFKRSWTSTTKKNLFHDQSQGCLCLVNDLTPPKKPTLISSQAHWDF